VDLFDASQLRWKHFHRHTAATPSTVLDGELHITDIASETGEVTGHKVRCSGDYAHKTPGDVHTERCGPDGALVLFNLYAPDGLLAETLARDGTLIGQSTLDQILKGRQSR